MAKRGPPRPPGYTPHQWRVSEQRWHLLHPGEPYSKQRARGHKEHEHIERKAKAGQETLSGVLLPQQKSAIKRVVQHQGELRGRTDADIARTIQASLDWATRQGFRRWVAFRAEVNGRGQEMRSMAYREWEGHYADPGWPQDISDRYDLPEEMDWLRQYK